MQAEVYGWNLKVLTGEQKPHLTQWGTKPQALGMLVLMAGVLWALATKKWVRGVAMLAVCWASAIAESYVVTAGGGHVELNRVSGGNFQMFVTGSGAGHAIQAYLNTQPDGSGTDIGVTTVTNSSSTSGPVAVTLTTDAWLFCRDFDSSPPFTLFESNSTMVPLTLVSTHVVVAIPANKTDHAIKYKLVDGAGNPVGTTVTQNPGDGPILQSMTTTGTPGPLSLVAQVDDVSQNSDGSWAEVPGAVTSQTVATGITPSSSPTPTPVTPKTPSVPATKTTPDQDKSVWKPNDTVGSETGKTSDLSIAAYREGVDKQISRIAGSGDGTSAVTLATSGETLWEPTTSTVTSAVAKLPTAPTLTDVTPASVITIAFEIPKLHGGTIAVNKTIDFAGPPYSTPITVFRNCQLVVLTLVFFLVVFWTIRGAFTTN